MIEATTELHVREAMRAAHFERAKAFAEVRGWVWGQLRGLFRAPTADPKSPEAVPC